MTFLLFFAISRLLLRSSLVSLITPIPSTVCGPTATNASISGREFATSFSQPCVESALLVSGAATLLPLHLSTFGSSHLRSKHTNFKFTLMWRSTRSWFQPAVIHCVIPVVKCLMPSGNNKSQQRTIFTNLPSYIVNKQGDLLIFVIILCWAINSLHFCFWSTVSSNYRI